MRLEMLKILDEYCVGKTIIMVEHSILTQNEIDIEFKKGEFGDEVKEIPHLPERFMQENELTVNSKAQTLEIRANQSLETNVNKIRENMSTLISSENAAPYLGRQNGSRTKKGALSTI
jgi:hypothetical protein